MRGLVSVVSAGPSLAEAVVHVLSLNNTEALRKRRPYTDRQTRNQQTISKRGQAEFNDWRNLTITRNIQDCGIASPSAGRLFFVC